MVLVSSHDPPPCDTAAGGASGGTVQLAADQQPVEMPKVVQSAPVTAAGRPATKLPDAAIAAVSALAAVPLEGVIDFFGCYSGER